MLERDIEKSVKLYARSKNWLAYKFTSPGHIGAPDGLFISPAGFVIFMEFKQTGKKPTAMQQREIDRINPVYERVGCLEHILVEISMVLAQVPRYRAFERKENAYEGHRGRTGFRIGGNYVQPARADTC